MYRLKKFVGPAGALACILLAPVTGYAPEMPDVDALDAIRAVDQSLLDAAAETIAYGDAVAVRGGTDGVTVSVPRDARDPLRISDEDGHIEVVLPFAESAGAGELLRPGVAAFDNGNESTTVSVVRDDGTVQVNTVLHSAAAPRRYTYAFELAETATIERFGDALLIVDRGTLIGGIAPAWAVDASGRDVSTYYLVNGHEVTQVVEPGSDADYPVVADPWLGINLWGLISVDSYNSQPRVNLNLSSWGWAVYSGAAQGGGAAGFAAGQAILNSAGWDEAWNRSATVRAALNKPSQRQQYECHALGALAAGTWNLEKFRPNRTAHWSVGVAVHHCNWTTASGY